MFDLAEHEEIVFKCLEGSTDPTQSRWLSVNKSLQEQNFDISKSCILVLPTTQILKVSHISIDYSSPFY
jgi:hypothetical protein